MNSALEKRLEQMISDLGLVLFPADVQDEVETILATGQGLEPETRARFVDAAQRGTRHLAMSGGAALEVLLFNGRRDRQQAAEDLATTVGIEADTIRAIERGERALDTEDAGAVALWALTLRLDRGTLDSSLRRSLGTPVRAEAYAGERQVRLTTEQADFVQRVLQAFEERDDSPATE